MRGFKTARSLARALGIDENRYTRYERAEVEPDIELIFRICETLRLSPNDLFGANDDLHQPPPATVHASASMGLAESGMRLTGVPGSDADFRRGKTSWRLACAVAELQEKGGGSEPRELPLAALQRAARLFADIERRPFSAISEILLLPAVTSAPVAEARNIGRLIEDLTETTV